MHYDAMTGGVNCGGGHRTRLREQLMCLWGAPAPVYKGGQEEVAGPRVARHGGEGNMP